MLTPLVRAVTPPNPHYSLDIFPQHRDRQGGALLWRRVFPPLKVERQWNALQFHRIHPLGELWKLRLLLPDSRRRDALKVIERLPSDKLEVALQLLRELEQN